MVVLCDVGSKYLNFKFQRTRVFMVSRLCLPQPVLIWSRDTRPMLLDLVFQKSSVSLVSAYSTIEICDSSIDTFDFSWLCDEGVFRWMDLSDEEHWPGK